MYSILFKSVQISRIGHEPKLHQKPNNIQPTSTRTYHIRTQFQWIKTPTQWTKWTDQTSDSILHQQQQNLSIQQNQTVVFTVILKPVQTKYNKASGNEPKETGLRLIQRKHRLTAELQWQRRQLQGGGGATPAVAAPLQLRQRTFHFPPLLVIK